MFANNSVTCYCQGHSTDSSTRIVFDGNAVWALGPFGSQGSGFSTFEAPNVLEHIYVGRSLDVGNPDPAVRKFESMTLDGPGGAITDTFASLSSDGTDGSAQTLTLLQPGRATPYPGGKNVSMYVGGSVAVLAGPGLGGTARVAAVLPTNSTWEEALVFTLHPPLITRPVPGESLLTINPFRGFMTWEGNTYVNDTTWQLWAQATDALLAGSYFQNISGDIRSWALEYQCPWPAPFACAWQPNVGIDFIRNSLRCAHALHAVTSDYAGVVPQGFDLKLNIGLTRRGNNLLGGENMEATGRGADFLSEQTTYQGCVCGGTPRPAGGAIINGSVAYALVL